MDEVVKKTVEEQKGVLFCERSLVGRGSYCGRNLLAPNSDVKQHGDERGYVLVERWILSVTQAGNEIIKENEGLSQVLLEGGKTKRLLKDLAPGLFGEEVLARWPLTKVLDIGGLPVRPDFSGCSCVANADGEDVEEEVPPIPCHCHAGLIQDGKAVGPGKLEAYFFPPVEGVPPYDGKCRLEKRIKTRLGFKPQTTKEEVLKALAEFGRSDAVYGLCNVFEIQPNEGWTIRPGVVHAPGPWPTFEIQRAQDDFNFLSWQLGQKINEEDLERKRQEFQLRGLANLEVFLHEVVDWDKSVDPQFRDSFHRPIKVLESGSWGRRFQIFFDEFYGEGFEVLPGHSYSRPASETPWGGLVWSGKGELNGNLLDALDALRSEFLILPGNIATFQATQDSTLYLYTVFPLRDQ